MLRLVKLWLKTPVEERDGEGKTRLTGGKGNSRGTPQGGVLSPLLANIYMRRLLLYFRMSGAAERFQAQIVNYADDFVILCRREGRQALEWTKRVTERIGLKLNESKTFVKDGRRDSFNFLGYTFGPMIWRKNGARYLGACPSRKAEKRIRERVKGLLYRGNPTPWPDLCQRLNRLLTGWANYFSYGSRAKVYCRTDRYVEDRVRRFLRKRHKIAGQGFRRFAYSVIYGELGVVCLTNLKKKERLACPA
jgi:RNA-directed DNA polymerase